jgi:hypothetical protein
MATTAAALIARARREIQHHFFSEDAVRPDRAIGFEPANEFQQRQFDRMVRREVIRQTSQGRYWLDVVSYDVDLRARHKRVKIALLAIIVALLVVIAFNASGL